MGKRQYVVKGTTFEVDDRYEVKKGVGQGAYGLICAAKDTSSDDQARHTARGLVTPSPLSLVTPTALVSQVAIKKISNAFEDAIDCKRMLREMRLLQHFKHENVLCLKDIMMPNGGKIKDWKDVYLVTELLDTDLHYIIHSKQQLSDDHIQYFVYQILRGLKAVHSAKVLHRDLKPGNLLVNKNCDLKICDFGLARGVDAGDPASQQVLTEYVVTRWYRAPELLVENETYGPAIDIWSVGCILAEFLGRKALFPGRDYLQQLRLIVETLGAPSKEDLSMINNPQAVEYIRALPKRDRVPFEKLYPNASKEAIDLLSKMLVFDPRKRITAAQSLEHEYLAALHNVNDEPDAEAFSFPFEKKDVSENELRGLIWEQLRRFHPEAGATPAEFLVQS